jgi:hypothetical protein
MKQRIMAIIEVCRISLTTDSREPTSAQELRQTLQNSDGSRVVVVEFPLEGRVRFVKVNQD